MINVGREAGRATLFQGKAGPWPHDFFAPGSSGAHCNTGMMDLGKL